MSTRMRDRWRDDPTDRPPTVDDPDVRKLIDQIAPGVEPTDLGGTMSLNLRLGSTGLLLRVHPRVVSRRRTLALQAIRRQLRADGLVVAEPRPLRGQDVLTIRGRCVELETLVPHRKPEATWESYRWMYGAMGRLHRASAKSPLTVPRPVISTYAPPTSLLRWLPVTEAAVRHDPRAADLVRTAHDLVGQLRGQWIPATALSNQLVHGDIRLGNVGLTPNGESAYLDFGFAAVRPRVHDLAYSLSWIVLRPDGTGTAENFDWERVPELVAEYEAAARVRLSELERAALAPYTAAVPLYVPAIIGHADHPVELLCDDRDGLAFLRISEWILANPAAVVGSAS